MKKLREMFPDGMYTDNSEGVFKRFKELLENDYRDSDESNFDSTNFCGLGPYCDYDLDLVQYNYAKSYGEISVYLTNKEFFNITLDENLTVGDIPEQLKEGVKPQSPYTPQIGVDCEACWLELPDGGNSEWRKVTYKGFYKDRHWFGDHDCDIVMGSDYCLFRPLRTERDMFIEQATEDYIDQVILVDVNQTMLNKIFGAMYDANYIKGE